MDAVELARQVAADLHSQAIARGIDPWRPYEFAVAEANRRDLDVEPTAVGAAMLDGGRAVFRPQERLILHENAGTDFEKAFLIAHEIGHVELGDDSADTVVHAIEPGRCAEASPIGLDRVIDYGPRQRREVQMDLFAREFLLPRAVVRKLHLEGMSATTIATKLGAPFEVVAQQLFDALLLPPIQPVTESARVERLLNREQQAASDHRGLPYLLEAGPGTGKTQTLTARVEGLLADGVDPRRILVLTFSNKAAREMAERIAIKNKLAASAMWIGTFHAFGLDLIRRFHSELGLPTEPRLMDRSEAVTLLENEFPRLGFTHFRNLYDPTQIIIDMLSAISRAKDEVVDVNQYRELAAKMLATANSPDALETAERVKEVSKLYECYERLKRQAQCVDFGDLVLLPVQLLENDASIRRHIQKQYDHVLVDEYQDVNRSSVRLLAAIRSDGENLWAVGDAKQSIYRFRGASSFNMSRFGKSDFVNGTRGRLKMNYRSRSEIVDAFSAFATQMQAADGESGLISDRGAVGAPPEHRTVDQSEQQSVALADAIEEMRAAGYSYSDQAVLCTGNDRLSSIGQDLERLGVPVLFLGSLFERSEVKDLLALLSLLTDRRGMGLLRAASWPDFEMSLDDVATIIEHLRSEEDASGVWLNASDSIVDLSAGGRAALDRLKTVLDGFDAASRPWIVLAVLLLDRTRTVARLASSSSIGDRSSGMALWQFLNFVRAQPSGDGLPIARLLDRIRRLVRLADERDLRQLPSAAQGIDAVRLMTVHGAKGLEFPVVHLPSMNAGTLPRTPAPPPCPQPDGMVEGAAGSALAVFRAEHAEEQECLYYVALSRARDRLFLYSPTRKSNGYSWGASPFLERMGPGLRRVHVTPTRKLPVPPEDAPVALLFDGSLRFSGSQISLYESCPRRFFYTHVLGVGGRRSVTAYMQMHEAVRAVLEDVANGADSVTDDNRLQEMVAQACIAKGLGEHGYVADYQALAEMMIRYFLNTRAGLRSGEPVVLRLKFGDEEIFVQPDDMLVRSDGRRVLRRVKTGHYRSSEDDDLFAAAFVLAAREVFPDAIVEVVHLSDQETRAVELSTKKLDARRHKLTNVLAEIRAGQFPAAPSIRTCPGCPAFFVCGPVPASTLQKKF